MFSTIFLPMLKWHLKLCHKILPFGYQLKDEKESLKIEVVSNAKTLFWHRLHRFLQLLYLGGMLFWVLFGKEAVLVKTKASGIAVGYLALFILGGKFWKFDRDPAQFWNSIFKWEQKILMKVFNKKEMRKCEKLWTSLLMKHLLKSLDYLTAPLCAFLNMSLILHNTCAHPFPWALTPLCVQGKWKGPSTLKWIPIFLAELWLTGTFTVVAALWFFNLYFGGIASFLGYIQLLKTTALNTRRKLKMYRQLHILEKIFNGYICKNGVPIMLSLMPFLQILFVVGCIKFYNDIQMPQFLLFPIVAINSFGSNVLISTLSAHINTTSKELLVHCMKTKGKDVVSLKKEIAACYPLKIKFGSNYIDRSTPLVIQNMCWCETISLIYILPHH